MNRIVQVAIALFMWQGGSQSELPVLADPEAYAVYAAVLPPQSSSQLAKSKRLVIAEETVTLERCKPDIDPLPEEWKSVLADYGRQNQTVWRLRSAFPVLHVMVSHAAIRKLLYPPEWDWTQFRAAYPDSFGGYHEFSAVGFDASKARAVLYVANHCGGECGQGEYHFMEKGPDGWRAAQLGGWRSCGWIS